jgi:hypothetical protein
VHEITSLTYNAEFLFQIEGAHEAQSCSTQRMSAFNLEQKGKLESASYFMHVPKANKYPLICKILPLRLIYLKEEGHTTTLRKL